MLTKKQVQEVIYWIDDNAIDEGLLQKFVSENSNTVEQLVSKYTVEYNNIYKKQLTSPMTKNIFMYLYDLYEKNPQTFHNCNINIDKNIVYSKKQKYFNIPQILQKMKNENIQLLKENKKLLQENNYLRIKYEGDSMKETKETKSSGLINEIINNY